MSNLRYDYSFFWWHNIHFEECHAEEFIVEVQMSKAIIVTPSFASPTKMFDHLILAALSRQISCYVDQNDLSLAYDLPANIATFLRKFEIRTTEYIFSISYLWCHVVRGAAEGVGCLLQVDLQLAHPEVDDPDVPLVVQQQVVQLEVSGKDRARC